MTEPTAPRFAFDSELWRTTTGEGYVRALGAGALPMPAHVDTLGYRIADVAPGSVGFDWSPSPALRNRAGFVQGGFVVALMDEASTYAAASKYPRFVPQTTVDLRADFLRPVSGDTLRVTGEVVRLGRSFSTVRAEVLDPGGRTLATLTATVVANRPLLPREVWEEAGL